MILITVYGPITAFDKFSLIDVTNTHADTLARYPEHLDFEADIGL